MSSVPQQARIAGAVVATGCPLFMMKMSVGPMEHGSMKPNKPKPTSNTARSMKRFPVTPGAA